jgi:gamma-glutamylcyclotransferase (GGCT)/AIG2-like uncharacterized protein YtfP
MIRLFTYGTLKKGFHNAFYLRDAHFLGEFSTDSLYSMYNFGNYPAVSEYGKTSIVGEVYEISEAQLLAIDRLEWCPNFYQRVRIETSFGEAWMYVVSETLCADKVRTSGVWN